MRGLRIGDRVVFTRYASRQCKGADSQCGVVTNTWDRSHSGPGALLRPNMIRVLRDGHKVADSWHHCYWRRP